MNAPNGKLIVGTFERLHAIANITAASTIDDLQYVGQVDVDWNTQETVTTEQGRRLFVDEDGGLWTEQALRRGHGLTFGRSVLVTMTETAMLTIGAANSLWRAMRDNDVDPETQRDELACDLARETDLKFDVERVDYTVVNRG